MILIKPNLSTRLFAGAAGLILEIMACLGLSVPLPGLIFTCLGLPLGLLAIGFALGLANTRVDETGIVQRNFFYLPKRLTWEQIQKGRVLEEEYRDQTSSAGWVEYRTRTVMEFSGPGATLRIAASSAGPENWWDDLRRLAGDKLGHRFEG